jgi:hypothetical protein
VNKYSPAAIARVRESRPTGKIKDSAMEQLKQWGKLGTNLV